MKIRRKTRIVPVPIIREQIRKEEVNLRKEYGKYLLDVSKLIIGGAVITTALQLNTDKLLMIVIAVSMAICACTFGFILLTNKNK